jgi:hypothetical protein
MFGHPVVYLEYPGREEEEVAQIFVDIFRDG